jgi:hypothetical protein
MLTLGIDIGIHNFSGCLVTTDAVNGTKSTVSAFVISLGDRKDPIDKLLTQLSCKIREMSGVFEHPDLARVVIEQQLGLQATKNYAISAAIFMHYADLRISRPALQVGFSNPRRKFTVLSKMQDAPGITEHAARIKAAKGPQLKRLSVELATVLATSWQDTVFLDYLNSLAKKDDVCDSWFLGMLC